MERVLRAYLAWYRAWNQPKSSTKELEMKKNLRASNGS